MTNRKLYNLSGITLGELQDFINDCIEAGIPSNTKIEIDHLDTNSFDLCKEIIADDESIRFYNYI